METILFLNTKGILSYSFITPSLFAVFPLEQKRTFPVDLWCSAEHSSPLLHATALTRTIRRQFDSQPAVSRRLAVVAAVEHSIQPERNQGNVERVVLVGCLASFQISKAKPMKYRIGWVGSEHIRSYICVSTLDAPSTSPTLLAGCNRILAKIFPNTYSSLKRIGFGFPGWREAKTTDRARVVDCDCLSQVELSNYNTRWLHSRRSHTLISITNLDAPLNNIILISTRFSKAVLLSAARHGLYIQTWDTDKLNWGKTT